MRRDVLEPELRRKYLQAVVNESQRDEVDATLEWNGDAEECAVDDDGGDDKSDDLVQVLALEHSASTRERLMYPLALFSVSYDRARVLDKVSFVWVLIKLVDNILYHFWEGGLGFRGSVESGRICMHFRLL